MARHLGFEHRVNSPIGIILVPNQARTGGDRRAPMACLGSLVWSGIFLLTLALIAVPASLAKASLLDRGDTTIDTGTRLEWLDLTMSLGRSYDDLIGSDGTNEFAVGGDFEGWRYATSAEVFTLFVDAGIPFINFGGGAIENVAPVMALEALVSITFEGVAPASFGITSTLVAPPAVRQLGTLQILQGAGAADANTLNFAILDSEAAPQVGSWLVRTVPEPPSLVLLVAGVALLGAKHFGRRHPNR